MEEQKTINNTFLIIAMGFGFWLIATCIPIYGFFFSGIIDWNQDISILEIIQLEMSKSARPMLIVIFWVIATIWALKDFRKLIKTPKYLTTLGDDYFEHVPMATESKYIKHDEVFAIKKSFFPLYGNRADSLHISHIFLLLVVPVSQIIFLITYVQKVIYWIYLKLFTNEPCRFMFFSYVLVFKDSSNVININLLHAKDYQKLDDYLRGHFGKEIAKLPINTTFVKTKEKTMGANNTEEYVYQYGKATYDTATWIKTSVHPDDVTFTSDRLKITGAGINLVIPLTQAYQGKKEWDEAIANGEGNIAQDVLVDLAFLYGSGVKCKYAIISIIPKTKG